MSMVEMKVSELTGAALDWAVAESTRQPITLDQDFGLLTGIIRVADGSAKLWRPSTDWSQGGPLIEHYISSMHEWDSGDWSAYVMVCQHFADEGRGATPLIATCRAIVAAKVGDTFLVPSEIAEVQS